MQHHEDVQRHDWVYSLTVRKTAQSAHSTSSQQARGKVERQSSGAWDTLMLLPTPFPPSSTK